MKLVSLLALTTALTIATPAVTIAQDATAGSTAEDAVTGAAGATAGGANASTETDASADANVDANIDTDGDGQISEEEQAAADAAADTDGDGAVSAQDRAAADAAGLADTVTCPDTGLESLTGMQGEVDESSIATATTARIVVVSECEAADVSAALAGTGATTLRTAIEANASLTAQIQARGATTADIVGAAMVGDVLTIYVTVDGTAS